MKLAEGGVGPWESSLATGTSALLEVQKALPVKMSRPLRPHLSRRLQDAKEGGWLFFHEACTLQEPFSPLLAPVILSCLELSWCSLTPKTPFPSPPHPAPEYSSPGLHSAPPSSRRCVCLCDLHPAHSFHLQQVSVWSLHFSLELQVSTLSCQQHFPPRGHWIKMPNPDSIIFFSHSWLSLCVPYPVEWLGEKPTFPQLRAAPAEESSCELMTTNTCGSWGMKSYWEALGSPPGVCYMPHA